jgi:multisubunit Na+/H+ antiporter MnhG subunit
LFILIISPTTEHALARASYIGGVKLWKKSVVDKFKEDIDKS